MDTKYLAESLKHARAALKISKQMNNDTLDLDEVQIRMMQREVIRLCKLSRNARQRSNKLFIESDGHNDKMPNEAKEALNLRLARMRSRMKPTAAVVTQTPPSGGSQLSTSLGFWVDEVEDMRKDITQIKQLLVKFESILVNNQTKQLEFLQKYFDRQTKQLRACQEAFQMNVDRDEELRTALTESADPWGGC